MSDIPEFWRTRNVLSYLLWPLSVLMAVIVWSRQFFYRQCEQGHAQGHVQGDESTKPLVPLLVIGNLSVGGNGKTPVVIALTKALLTQGIKVGIVSRGYGGRARHGQEVELASDATEVGDEALLIKAQCQVPVFIDKKRTQAVKALLKHYPQTQIILSDDGLQHYAMSRTLEWVVIAKDIGLGNGFLLPAGPLREPVRRLHSVDNILLHGEGDFTLPCSINKERVITLRQVNQGFRLLSEAQQQYQPIATFNRYNQFSALTAIARPERFFTTLTQMGIILSQQKTLPDHAQLPAHEAEFAQDQYLIITEKDAVKTINWPMALKNRTLVLAHELMLPTQLLETVINHINHYNDEKGLTLEGKL